MTTAQDATSFHLGLLSSTVDSIEREVKVSQQNKKLLILNQVIIENSRNGIIITNETGNIIELNPFAERVLACSKEVIVNNPITKVATIGTYVENVIKENRKYEDIEIKISDNIFLFDAFPIYDECNRIIGAFGQFRDITERLLLEKQVMASEKLSAIGKFSAGLAHEIRNPLTSIIGLLKLVKRNVTATDPRHKEYFKIIFSELERIKSLVHQFVMLAKPEQKEISKSNTRIRELVGDVILLMDSQMSSKNIKVTYDASFEESVHVDSDKMKQVLINVLQNSFDAIEYNGEIWISTNRISDGNGIEIKIKDNGEGMDQDTLERISTPFFTTKINGLGLGLSMSYNIIELHKGTIKAESEKGKGTTFTISLPRQ
jgi:signal transduction histidine kinase